MICKNFYVIPILGVLYYLFLWNNLLNQFQSISTYIKYVAFEISLYTTDCLPYYSWHTTLCHQYFISRLTRLSEQIPQNKIYETICIMHHIDILFCNIFVQLFCKTWAQCYNMCFDRCFSITWSINVTRLLV